MDDGGSGPQLSHPRKCCAIPVSTLPSKKKKVTKEPFQPQLPDEGTNGSNSTSIKGIMNASIGDNNFIDISGIQVEAHYDKLKSIFTEDPVFQGMAHSLDVLTKLKTLPDNDDAMPPSQEIQDFLSAIETANPKTCVDKDAVNQSWGHEQFRNGVKQFNSILWDNINTSKTGFRILAATI
ncbi:hypothetical protein Clacol_004951 [Clathrus columnatus]|uniref:Uncharacterized protein n=1 Tax=Clathrus columnatus TaxID=1419009 RepID=A0AAV5A7X6_9AGAM|nr:hypothetical protein Clacol_004951 [Clathrus columnatus]